MNINRDNYEEYFLLYADNELTDSEKAEVLMFVMQNKDLEDEFRMIHFTISRPDKNIHLADKSFLFRDTNSAFINEKNYEEIFVLYHDNELTAKGKLETENFILRHKDLKSEFDLIGLARLTPEVSVVFRGKKRLYKKGKPGKVVPVMFWRMIAAALFIGFGLWITFSYLQKPEESKTITHAIPAKTSLPENEKRISLKESPVDVAQSASRKSQSADAETMNKNKKKQQVVSKKPNNDNIAVKPGNTIQVKEPDNKEKENNINQLPGTVSNEAIASNQEITDASTDEITTLDKIKPAKELPQNVQNSEEKAEPVIYAKNASYLQDDNSENYVFYDITTDEFKKTKVGGFLKKVKRVIQRNNPIARLLSPDDGQVASN